MIDSADIVREAILRQSTKLITTPVACVEVFLRRILSGVKLHAFRSWLLFLGIVQAVVAQSTAESPSNTAQQAAPSVSESHTKTVSLIGQFLSDADPDEIAQLFTMGSASTADLITACERNNNSIGAIALQILQLLGKLSCKGCADSAWQKHTGLGFACAASLNDSDFDRIHRWLANTRTTGGYNCQSPDRPRNYEPLAYALILDGSPRAHEVLAQMLAMENACSGTDTYSGEVVQHAAELSAEANRIARNLTLRPDVETAIRASAFFVPPATRQDAKIRVLARTEDRILADLSSNWVQGSMGGREYYVVLRKDGSVWQYAVIMLAVVTN